MEQPRLFLFARPDVDTGGFDGQCGHFPVIIILGRASHVCLSPSSKGIEDIVGGHQGLAASSRLLVRILKGAAVASAGCRSLTRFSGQFTCRHHAASAAAAGLLSYSTGLRSPIEV